MERFEELISALDYVLESKRRRHIVGGVLLSISVVRRTRRYDHYN